MTRKEIATKVLNQHIDILGKRRFRKVLFFLNRYTDPGRAYAKYHQLMPLEELDYFHRRISSTSRYRYCADIDPVFDTIAEALADYKGVKLMRP